MNILMMNNIYEYTYDEIVMNTIIFENKNIKEDEVNLAKYVRLITQSHEHQPHHEEGNARTWVIDPPCTSNQWKDETQQELFDLTLVTNGLKR